MAARKMTNKKKVARGPTPFTAFQNRIAELEKSNEELKNAKEQLSKQRDEAIAQRGEAVRGLQHVVEGIVGAHALFELFNGRLSTDLSTSDEARAVRSALQVAGKTGVAVLDKLQPRWQRSLGVVGLGLVGAVVALSWLGLRRNNMFGVAGDKPPVPTEK